MATLLRIDRKTLRKVFKEELTSGALERRTEVIEGLHKSAKSGNVSAQKAFAALTPRLGVTELPPQVEQPKSEEPQPKQPKLGKKEQADIDAISAAHGTEWEDLLPDSASLQ